MRGELDDIGFADADAARALVRRLAVREAIAEARASIEALLDLLQEPHKAVSCKRAALVEEAVRLAAGDEPRDGDAFGVRLSETDVQRERELLECVNLLPQLLDEIGVGVRHGLFSGLVDAGAMSLCDCGHSLCGGAK